METKDVQHACSGSTRLPQTAHLHDVNCQPGLGYGLVLLKHQSII